MDDVDVAEDAEDNGGEDDDETDAEDDAEEPDNVEDVEGDGGEDEVGLGGVAGEVEGIGEEVGGGAVGELDVVAVAVDAGDVRPP